MQSKIARTFIYKKMRHQFLYFRLLLVFVFMQTIAMQAETSRDSISYVPEVHGVIRGRWELETQDGYSHFQVRNARVSIEGYAAPIITYKINSDFCDRGKIMLLDAYATVMPLKGLDILLGQYRMPFGIESFRGPGGYYFNNRSYIGKNVNNYRAVGLSVGYTLPKLPLSVEGGIFNPTEMDDHTTWVKKYAYAARIIYRPKNWLFATGFESIRPSTIRINLVSATLGWIYNRFYVEGEYMVRCYTHNSHKTTQAYNIFANYDFHLKKGLFDNISVQARFDGMSDLANGIEFVSDNNSKLETTANGRRRVTVGGTLDYKYKRLRAAVRLNFEKCWYNHKIEKINRGAGDMLSAELIVKF